MIPVNPHHWTYCPGSMAAGPKWAHSRHDRAGIARERWTEREVARRARRIRTLVAHPVYIDGCRSLGGQHVPDAATRRIVTEAGVYADSLRRARQLNTAARVIVNRPDCRVSSHAWDAGVAAVYAHDRALRDGREAAYRAATR